MSRNLDSMFKKIQKNSEELGMAAMMSAAKKAYKLAVAEAKSCLKNYLNKKPKRYDRLNPSPLEDALMYSKPKLTEEKGVCYISFALRYDSSKIVGKYESNSWWHQSGGEWVSRFKNENNFKYDSQANGIPDAGWILNNYLEGVHPGWYNGVDYGWKDARKTKDTMKNFFEKELHDKAGQLIYEAMQGAIVDFLKTNGGGK